MRLYLSSYKVGNHPERFLELLGDNKKVAVIRNAVDYAEPEDRRESVERAVGELKKIGLTDIEEVDLRNFFGREKELEERLKEFGGIWIAGGNVFVLKRTVEKSGFEPVIKKLLLEDSIVYAGYSAGACLAAPTLRGIEFVDDLTLAYRDGREDFSWGGLGLIPYSIAPHYRSNHHESERIEKTVEYFEKQKIPYKTLRDGEAIVIEGGKETLLT
ncbi:Type 1 glutamine amidotransferase-like domain-containing protein [Candidatus Kaiserbacteria bacterium]|nr:Type 1 glutamine amidotransferase-like domain-containing protein [Candidatus Kaiserbacteria bacterium]